MRHYTKDKKDNKATDGGGGGGGGGDIAAALEEELKELKEDAKNPRFKELR